MSVKQAGNSNAGPAYVSITAGYYNPESMAKTNNRKFCKRKCKPYCKYTYISWCYEYFKPEK